MALVITISSQDRDVSSLMLQKRYMKIQFVYIMFQNSKTSKLEILGNTRVNESSTQFSKRNYFFKEKGLPIALKVISQLELI